MDTVFRGLLKQTYQPQKFCIRLRTKINLKKPRPAHFTRAKVEELCKVKFPKQIGNKNKLYELCQGPGFQKKELVNPYEIMLAKEALNWFRNHKYIFFFHENSMRYEENLDMQVLLKKCGVKVCKFGKNTLKHTFLGTMYEPTLSLFHSHTLLGFGNDVNLSSMLSGLKKTKIILLAGIIDNRLLSISEIQYYSNLPNIGTLRASLVSVLNAAAGQIVEHLNHHPQMLVCHLEQYGKLSKEEEK